MVGKPVVRKQIKGLAFSTSVRYVTLSHTHAPHTHTLKHTIGRYNFFPRKDINFRKQNPNQHMTQPNLIARG